MSADPDAPPWLPPLAIGLVLLVTAWASAPFVAELVGAYR